MAGQIHRKKKTSNFIMLDKTALQDPRLSWKAKGLHSYLIGLPDDWKINIADLSNRSEDGRESTGNGMKELIAAGYVQRTRALNEKNQFEGYDYEVSEHPDYSESVNGETEDGKPVYGKPASNKDRVKEGLSKLRKDMSAQTADGLPEKPSLDANPSEGEKTPSSVSPPAKKAKADPNDCRKVAEPLLESIKQEGIRLLAENAAPEKLDRLRKKYQALEKDIRIEYDTDKAINLLNELVGTEYETETPAYRKLARLRFQKYSYAQMELVIRYKVKEWKDNDKMRGYLRPSTLFNGSFAEYLEAAKLDKIAPLTPNGQVETSGFPQNIPVYGR